VVQLGQPLDDVKGMPPGVSGFAGLAQGVETVAEAVAGLASLERSPRRRKSSSAAL